jgi:hypothetical protein
VRRALIILVLSLITNVSWAQETLTATVHKVDWTTDNARGAAFNGARKFIDTLGIPELDPNLQANRTAMDQGLRRSQDRSITLFDNGTYTVSTLCDLKTYLYLPNGLLIQLMINSSPAYGSSYCPSPNPMTSWTYAVNEDFWSDQNIHNGQFMDASIYVKDNESFSFKSDGSLSFHWKDNYCYEADGSSCGTRKRGATH